MILISREVSARSITGLDEYNVEGEPATFTGQREARFFGFGSKISDYSPFNYYGYGYRPFWGNFGGYLGYFGR